MSAPGFSTPLFSLNGALRRCRSVSGSHSVICLEDIRPEFGACASLCVALGNSSEMNRRSLFRTQTPAEEAEDRPRTPVTALRPHKRQ